MTGAAGVGFTVTVIEARGLSHPNIDCDTHSVVTLGVAVLIVAGVVEPVPPTPVVYQYIVLPDPPVTVKGTNVCPVQ